MLAGTPVAGAPLTLPWPDGHSLPLPEVERELGVELCEAFGRGDGGVLPGDGVPAEEVSFTPVAYLPLPSSGRRSLSSGVRRTFPDAGARSAASGSRLAPG